MRCCCKGGKAELPRTAPAAQSRDVRLGNINKSLMHFSSSMTVSKSWKQTSVQCWEKCQAGSSPKWHLPELQGLWDHPSTGTELRPCAEQQHCPGVPACSTCLSGFPRALAAPPAAVPVCFLPLMKTLQLGLIGFEP